MTLWRQADKVHQTTTLTFADRYPELFDLTQSLAPKAERVLSFGCSTGEEVSAIRDHFPGARILGAEINGRARAIAARRFANEDAIAIVPPDGVDGQFDVIFCMAVLQREPHRVAKLDLRDLTPIYPFERFDEAVASLVDRLAPGGLLCVDHAHYRIEDSTSAALLDPVERSPTRGGLLFGCDGKRLTLAAAGTLFRKRGVPSPSERPGDAR